MAYRSYGSRSSYGRRSSYGYGRSRGGAKSKVYAKYAVGYVVMYRSFPAKVIQVRQRFVQGVKNLAYEIQFLTGKSSKKWVGPYELRPARY